MRFDVNADFSGTSTIRVMPVTIDDNCIRFLVFNHDTRIIMMNLMLMDYRRVVMVRDDNGLIGHDRRYGEDSRN